MPGKRGADFFARWRGRSPGRAPAVVKRHRLDNEARRAEAALQGVMRHERLLHRVQFRRTDAFDCRHRFAGDRLRRHQAAHDRRAVDQHRAGAADARTAHKLCARQAEAVAHDIDEECIGIVGQGCGAAVDRHRAHLRSPGLRADFFAVTGLVRRGFDIRFVGFADAVTAPATSVRTMVSRSARNAGIGCIAGCMDLAP